MRNSRIALPLAVLGLVVIVIAVISTEIAETATAPVLLLAVGLVCIVSAVIIEPTGFKRSIKSRAFKHSVVAIYQTVLVFGIFVCIYVFAARHPSTYDLTREGVHTLATQSIKVVQSLHAPVKVLAFFLPNKRSKTRNLLEQLQTHAKGRLSFEFINPNRSPSLTKEHEVTKPGTLVFICEDRSTKITQMTQQAVTNALIKVTRKDKKKIYFIGGHGEMDRSSGEPNGMRIAAKALQQDQYEVDNLFLQQEESIPDKTRVLVISGPSKAYTANERQLLASYLEAGGGLVVLVDPGVVSGLEPLLDEWGIELGEDIIIDPVSQLSGTNGMVPVIRQYGRHEITRDFKNTYTFFPLARSVRKENQIPKGVSIVELCKTTEHSWGERSRSRKELQFTPGVDLKGPLSVALALSRPATDKKRLTRIVVIGDSDFASNKYYGEFANGNLFENAVNWVAGEEDLVSIKARTLKTTQLELTRRSEKVLFYVTVLALPVFFLLAGGAVWYVRRSL